MRDAAPAMRKITRDDIECLTVGAWILGTGGGGSPYLGLLNMRWLYGEGHRVELMSPFDLADDDRVAVVSNMGAPLVGQERLADSRNIARAVEMQQDYSGVKFRAVMSLEIGGGNGIQPLMAAAHLGLPVVDADLMGRAARPKDFCAAAASSRGLTRIAARRSTSHFRTNGSSRGVSGATSASRSRCRPI